MKILRPDHFTVLSVDLDATRDFYTELLGLMPGPRPDLSMDGIWLYAGEFAIVHVVRVERLPAERQGVLDHMAFRADSLEPLIERLDARGIDYRLIRTPAPWQQQQIFFHGPSGEKIEVDADIAP